MTETEFIAWFEGFTGRLKGRPARKDWDEIVARVGKVDARSPLKAWFEGLRVKIKTLPNEREWAEIKKRVTEEAARSQGGRGRLQGLFESFEEKAADMRTAPGKTSGPRK